MSPLEEWMEATRRRRREHVPGAAFSPGLLEGDPVAARRAVATMLVTLVGDRRATVRFTPGTSCAEVEGAVVNVDGALVDPPDGGPAHVDELVVGVAAHEGGHLLLSGGPGQRARPIRRWLYNLVEDERVEATIARRWPPLAAPLATTRRELLRSELPLHRFLHALFFLVRAPDRLPESLWLAFEYRLRRAIRILTPFPHTPAKVARAIRRLERLVPWEERKAVPDFPSFMLGCDRAARRSARPVCRRGLADEWTESAPAVVWADAPPDGAGYAKVSGAAQANARALHAVLLQAQRPRRLPAARSGVLDRRRLHAWSHDDRLFRSAHPGARPITLVVILDLSGSMRTEFAVLQHVAVAFSEAAHGLPHVRLYVYGHAADGGGVASTEITRFATPAGGPVLSLGTLPAGGNNRDGHALELIARDLAEREPSRRRARVAIHVCDGDPSAIGYQGLPAREATRKGILILRRSFGPLVLLGIGTEERLTVLGTTVVMWRDGGGIGELARTIGTMLSP